MRFGLRHLLYMFLAWAISFVIAENVDFQSERVTWSFDAVYADICQTRPFLVDELASNPSLSVIELQEEMESGFHGFSDVWGNPFRIVEHGGQGEASIQLYSCGIDGVSASGGNDLDDINSWNFDRQNYYGKFDVIRRRQKTVRANLILAPIMFIILIVLDRAFRRMDFAVFDRT